MGGSADDELADCRARLAAVSALVRAKLSAVFDHYENGEPELVGPSLDLDVDDTEALLEILSPTFACPGCAEKDRSIERWVEESDRHAGTAQLALSRLEQAREAWKHVLPVNGNTGKRKVEDRAAAEYASKLDSALDPDTKG